MANRPAPSFHIRIFSMIKSLNHQVTQFPPRVSFFQTKPSGKTGDSGQTHPQPNHASWPLPQFKQISPIILILALFAAGCSRFDRQWRLTESPATRWEGTWRSFAGHGGGALWCVLTPTSDDQYLAQFKAGYLGILRAEYEVPMKGQNQNGELTLSGEKDLGALAGGVFTYEAKIKDNRFDATYRSKDDQGEFRLVLKR
jgi:hypothetical protein